MTEFAKTVTSATNGEAANTCASTSADNVIGTNDVSAVNAAPSNTDIANDADITSAANTANAATNIDAVQRSEGTFAYQNVHLHYVRWVSSTSENIQAPIILLHGFAQSAESWEEIASQLALNRTVYALDLIGHGKSDCSDDAAVYAIDFQADALCSFMDYVSCETLAEELNGSAAAGRTDEDQPEVGCAEAERAEVGCAELDDCAIATLGQSGVKPIVVGYSMGGRVALAATVRSPEKFGALVLESAGLGPATEQDREAAATSDTARAKSLRTDGLEVFMDAWEKLPLFASQAHLPQETQAIIRARRLANNAEALAYTFENAGQHCMPDRTCVLDALLNAEFPVLYICGALDEKYCALAAIFDADGPSDTVPSNAAEPSDTVASNAAEPSDTKPDAASDAAKVNVQIIDGVGHNVHLENPARYLGALKAFLDAI